MNSEPEKRSRMEMIEELRRRGLVQEVIFSDPARNPTEEQILAMPEDIQDVIPMLIEFRNWPIMIDHIRELGYHNSDRNKTKKELIQEDKELEQVYVENKLESSGLTATMSYLTLLFDDCALPPEILERFEKIRMEINGTDNDNGSERYAADRYKEQLDTEQRVQVAKDLDTLIADIFTFLISQEKKS